MEDFLKEDLEFSVWDFCRRGRKNSPVSWRRCETTKASQPFAGFDVEPSLLKMWGMFANFRRTDGIDSAELPKLYLDRGAVDTDAG